eukprot:1409500-Rhodomonas_salina.2
MMTAMRAMEYAALWIIVIGFGGPNTLLESHSLSRTENHCRSVDFCEKLPKLAVRFEANAYGWKRLRGGGDESVEEDVEEEESTEQAHDDWEKERLRRLYEQAAKEFPDVDYQKELEVSRSQLRRTVTQHVSFVAEGGRKKR